MAALDDLDLRLRVLHYALGAAAVEDSHRQLPAVLQALAGLQTEALATRQQQPWSWCADREASPSQELVRGGKIYPALFIGWDSLRMTVCCNQCHSNIISLHHVCR